MPTPDGPDMTTSSGRGSCKSSVPLRRRLFQIAEASMFNVCSSPTLEDPRIENTADLRYNPTHNTGARSAMPPHLRIHLPRLPAQFSLLWRSYADAKAAAGLPALRRDTPHPPHLDASPSYDLGIALRCRRRPRRPRYGVRWPRRKRPQIPRPLHAQDGGRDRRRLGPEFAEVVEDSASRPAKTPKASKNPCRTWAAETRPQPGPGADDFGVMNTGPPGP